MTFKRVSGIILSMMTVALLSGCSGAPDFLSAGSGAGYADSGAANAAADEEEAKIWDLFNSSADPNITVNVNKYIWNASLDVLSFMPVEAADPFSGVIVMGYGTPPGGGRSYRATIYVKDPALDARSLTVALKSRSGTVGRDTQRAVEDAILTRARQLRIADSKL